MPTREILTFQFGHYSNFIGTHWWNIQEAGFEYNPSLPSEIDHDVLFREGLTPQGRVTYTPRLLLVDLKGSLRTLTQEGELYDSHENASEVTTQWQDGKVELKEQEKEFKNEFQNDLMTEKPEVVMKKKYNLESEVKVWSDYLYPRLHPRSVNIVDEYEHCNPETPFDSFSLGSELWKYSFEDNFVDKIRNYLEECDCLQGFHMLTDCTNAFAGLSATCLEYLHDEFEHKSVLVFPSIPAYFPDNDFETAKEQVYSIMNDSVRVINTLLSFNKYVSFSSLFAPLCASQNGWRQPGIPREFYHTNFNHKLPYHSGAILASALDTATLKYRLKASNMSLGDLSCDLTSNGRKAVVASLCLPFSFNADADFIECLDLWDGPLYKSLSPRCSIGTERVVQHLTLRGIEEARLKKPPNKAGKQRDMPAYQCKTIKDMLEFYLGCTTYASINSVATVAKGMPTKNPFPTFFDEWINADGNVHWTPRAENMRVDSVPVLAGFHSSTDIGAMFESLHSEAAKLKITRFHQFALERDEYEESLNDLLSFKENYEDNYLI
ncbi:protein misato [Euwallacea similis]|uniref:protein misato n=1 Tax=Euwallacea similis TaxID=1736056 RepID=UPI00344DE208